MSIKDFVAAEKAAQEKQRAEYLDGSGYRDFIKWDVGSTTFTLESTIPRDHDSFGKPVKVFQIIIDEEEYDWSVNPRSPMYGDILDKLEAGGKGVLTRVGLGLETRYGLVWIED